VAEAVAQTGYVPNLLAGGLASTRSRLVAAVVPTITGPVFMPTVEALTEALAERGYHLMLGQSGYVGNREDALLEAILGRRRAGWARSRSAPPLRPRACAPLRTPARARSARVMR
jgi:LacI family gluconate utilization system Gnt-I transcriptional repressor